MQVDPEVSPAFTRGGRRGRAGPRGIPAGLLVVKVQDGHARRLACSVSVGFDWSSERLSAELYRAT